MATERMRLQRPVCRPHGRAVWLVAWAGLAVAVAAAVVIERASFSEERQTPRPELRQTLDRLVTGHKRIAPGVAAYVAGPHGEWSGSAGVANVATSEPMQPDTRVRLESVSKLWLATLIMQLAGDGRLRLDDSVEQWLPGVFPYGRQITVHQLLSHTSGMVDTNDITHDSNRYIRAIKDPLVRARVERVSRRLEKNPFYEFSPRLWIDFAAALPLEYPPDTTFHYSNIGYLVAGEIAERTGGAGLATLFRKRIVEPLHLKNAAYDPAANISGEHAHGYGVAHDGRLTDTTRWTGGTGAAGGIVSDATDEAQFLQALMQGRILKPAQLAVLKRTSPHGTYALGVGLSSTGCGEIAFGHNGGGEGFETNVLVSADGRRVAVLLLNGRTDSEIGDGIAVETVQRLYCAA